VSLESVTYPGYFVRQCDFLGYVTPLANNSLNSDIHDSSFEIIEEGLINEQGYISFESINYPGRFLYVSNGQVTLSINDNSTSFATYASFIIHSVSNYYYFESAGMSGNYLTFKSNGTSICSTLHASWLELWLKPLNPGGNFTSSYFFAKTANVNSTNGVDINLNFTNVNSTILYDSSDSGLSSAAIVGIVVGVVVTVLLFAFVGVLIFKKIPNYSFGTTSNKLEEENEAQLKEKNKQEAKKNEDNTKNESHMVDLEV